MTDMIKWQSALIAFVVCMCQMFTPAGAQEAGTWVHVVQRGEDIGSVAAKYGTTAAALAELNYGLDVFYAGMKINVPAKAEARPASAAPQTAAAPPQNSAAPQQAEAEHGGTANAFGFAPNAVYNDDPRRTDAELAMANGEYKDAVKLFTKIIKDNPGGAGWKCYYFRGYCNYQRGKYKSAIEDLEEAFNDVQCRGEHRETVSELLADAQSKRQEQLQNRAQTWGAIIGTTALLGAATYASVQAAKSSQAASKSATTTATTPKKSIISMSEADIAQQMRQIGQMSVQQVQQQMALEKMQVNNSFIQTYRRIHGKDPTEWEINENYNQYIQTKVNAANAVRQADSGVYDGGLSVGSGNNTSNNTTGTRRECSLCHGKGTVGRELSPANIGHETGEKETCKECGGTFLVSSAHRHVPCPNCHGKKYFTSE